MEINDKETERQIELLRFKIAEASKGIAERKKNIVVWNKMLAKLTGEEGLPWTGKAVECIKFFGYLASADEILRFIFADRLEDLENSIQRRKYMTGLSVALHKLVEAGKLKRFSAPGVRGYVYGLPEWWNDNNELDTYYKYDLKNRLEKKKAPASTGA